MNYYLGSLVTKLYVSHVTSNKSGFTLTNNMTKALKLSEKEAEPIRKYIQEQTGLVFELIPC